MTPLPFVATLFIYELLVLNSTNYRYIDYRQL